MRIFLTGATGYIGSALARKLSATGHEVVALIRDEKKKARLAEAGLQPVLGDFKDPARWRDEVDSCETIVHLGFESGPNAESVDRQAVAALLESAKAARAPRMFVYTSEYGCWARPAVQHGLKTAQAAALARCSMAVSR